MIAPLGPVERLLADLDGCRPGDTTRHLVEHLANYGPDGLDVQALAELALAKDADE